MNRLILTLSAAVLFPVVAFADAVEDKIEKIAKSMGGYNGVERDSSKPGRPVTVVKMQHAKAIPVDVCKQIGELKQVQKIFFTGSPITDAGVKELIPIGKTLTFLDLGGSKITSVSLKHIAQMKNLTVLSMSDSAVSNENLKELQNLKNLTHLHLSRSKITPASFDDLAALKSLKELHLVEMRLPNDAFLELKKKMPKTLIYR